MPDLIHIEALEVHPLIGVPDEERAKPQRLTVTLTLEPRIEFRTLGDRFEATIDYAAVCSDVEAIAQERPRKLVETLAEDIASGLLKRYPIRQLTVEVRKFILPQTNYVAVRIDRP